jgi:hypothetical protein
MTGYVNHYMAYTASDSIALLPLPGLDRFLRRNFDIFIYFFLHLLKQDGMFVQLIDISID